MTIDDQLLALRAGFAARAARPAAVKIETNKTIRSIAAKDWRLGVTWSDGIAAHPSWNDTQRKCYIQAWHRVRASMSRNG